MDSENFRWLRADELKVDVQDERVLLGREPVHLAPNAFRLLTTLMRRPTILHTKESLLLTVWDGRSVSDAVLTTAMREVRRALGDSAREPRFIETVHGRGYRFLLSVERVGGAPRQDDARAARASREMHRLRTLSVGGIVLGVVALAVWGLRSPTAPVVEPQPATGSETTLDSKTVAVLPFTNRSLEDEHALFVDGLHDDLVARLSQISALKVISRASVLRRRETDRTVQELAAELGAAVLLYGTVQRSGDRVRITVQLVDGESAVNLWAEIYDRVLTARGLFEIQAEITRSIAGKLKSLLSGSDERALAMPPTESLEAYEAYIAGKLTFDNAGGVEPLADALARLDDALALDPSFADAYAVKAHVELAHYWYGGLGREWVDAAQKSLERAETLAPDSPRTLVAAGYYHYWGHRDYAAATNALERALQRAPNDAEAWELKAYVARRNGRFDETVSALEKAHVLNPLDIEIATERLETYAPLGDFELAQEMIEVAKTINPTSVDLANNAARMWRYKGETEKAWAAISAPVSHPGFGHYFRLFKHSLLTRDAETILSTIDAWPEEFRTSSSFLEAYNQCRARALLAAGRVDEAKALLRSIKERVDALEVSHPAGWAPNTEFFPVEIPSLLGDAGEVQRQVRVYEANAANDQWQTLKHWEVIAVAFARVGEKSRAFDYLERLTLVYGPQLYLRFSIDPDYDVLRGERRWQQLQARYEDWNDARRRGER